MATKHELKIQQSHAPERWSCSLRVRGPHFASKVSYNAGAATDDYAGQIKAELVFHNKSVGYSVSLLRNHPKPTVLYVPQYVANFVSKKSCSI